MNRVLPEPLLQKAERLATERGYETISDYLSDLLEREDSPGHPFAGREAEVEAALLEGLASGPAEPMTADDWQDLKRRVVEIHAVKNP